MNLIVKALNLRNNQVIYDLGAGDGIVIYSAANEAFKKKLNTKFIAVEINPILLIILHLRRLFNINRANIKVMKADIFNLNYNSKSMKQWNNEAIQQINNIVVYLYVSPWFIEKIILNAKRKLENIRVVSYMYPIKSLKKKEKIIHGKNSIFVYK